MHLNRGDISLFLVLIIGTTMLGSAVLLSLILARQVSLSEDLEASERAFYAASAGVEKGFYDLALAIKAAGGANAPADIPMSNITGTIVYTAGGEEATFDGRIFRKGGTTCGIITGKFREETRRIQIGPDEC